MPGDDEIAPYGNLVQPPEETNLLSRQVIGICIEIHRELGPGLPEEAYELALMMEFDARGIRYERQHRIEVQYKAGWSRVSGWTS